MENIGAPQQQQFLKHVAGDKDADWLRGLLHNHQLHRRHTDSLNHFFSHFDHQIAADTHPGLPGKVNAIQLDQHEVRSTLPRINVRKGGGPDRVTGRILKACTDQPVPPSSSTSRHHNLQSPPAFSLQPSSQSQRKVP